MPASSRQSRPSDIQAPVWLTTRLGAILARIMGRFFGKDLTPLVDAGSPGNPGVSRQPARREVMDMRTGHRWIVFLLVSLLLIPGLAFAARKGRLIGKVLDANGAPIGGVAVTATSPDLPGFKVTKTTDKKGVFTLDFREIDVTYVYRFEKPGFQTLQAEQHWGLEGTHQYEWTLHEGRSTVDDGPPPASTSAEAILAYNAGITAMRNKDNITAVARLKEATVHDPELRQAWAVLSSVHLELGNDREAAEAAEKAIALGALDESVLVARWQAYRNLKDETQTARALAELERIGRRLEEAKRVHNEAVALTKTGDNEGAFAKFQEALTLDPSLRPSLLGLATAGVAIGRNAEAVEAAETILKTEPGNEKALRLRFNAALALGDKVKLADALVGLAAIEPKVAHDGLLRLAFEAYDASDMTLAKQRFAKVLEIAPDSPMAHYYIGLISVGQGASPEARRHLQRFVELAPNDPEADSAREMLKHLGKS